VNTVTLSNENKIAFSEEICNMIGLKAGTSFEVILYKNRIELIPINSIKKLKGLFNGINTDIFRDEDRL